MPLKIYVLLGNRFINSSIRGRNDGASSQEDPRILPYPFFRTRYWLEQDDPNAPRDDWIINLPQGGGEEKAYDI